ncbi:hypothetical protein [Streptomyces camelliae]|uniref:Regulatory protein n=1 Tax=Streptomyces camelliae TaxID=3004093 RepID=A0ABY7NUW7_9ACTN|nr:hypothetical protein [Streptomyces sp. HUAS 2-6]WBO62015.1 hypothetical protein O1G22_03790 [Streptomyces sp. HUAS 2-6]
MSESITPVTELTSQYVSQVSNDLEHNVKEQERITAEIAALQEQLTGLQHDHGVLVSMQQALGVTPPAATEGVVVPAPRKKSTTATGPVKTPKKASVPEPEAKKQPAKKPVAKKAAAKKPEAKKAAPQAAQPTLVELVRRHLADQKEPRSAAEVAEALGKALPDREIQTKVIRTTLENLVARNGAQRTKQGTSVFYTVPAAAEPAAASEPEAGSDASA